MIPTDQTGRIRPDSLRGAMDNDVRAGRKPLAVIANAGTTAAGAIDPFLELAQICGEEGIWLHVDGAYGAFAAITERGRGGARRDRARRLDHPGPAQVAVPADRGGACSSETGERLRHGFEIVPDFLQDVEAVDRRGELLRSRRPAHREPAAH